MLSHNAETRGVARGHADKGPAEGGLARVLAHQVGVPDAIVTADLEYRTLVDFEVERSEQVFENILNGDRLVRETTQRGMSRTGERSTRPRTISKNRLPDPTMIEARNSTVGTPDSPRIRPTLWRLARCVESFSSAPRPPR